MALTHFVDPRRVCHSLRQTTTPGSFRPPFGGPSRTFGGSEFPPAGGIHERGEGARIEAEGIPMAIAHTFLALAVAGPRGPSVGPGLHGHRARPPRRRFGRGP